MAVFCPALIYLNYFLVPKAFPAWVKPHPFTRIMMGVVTMIYVSVSGWYIWVLITG